jgi:hypothetical protein
VNFLVLAGWDYDKVDAWIADFNKNSPEPLREVTIKGHLRHHKGLKDKMMPPSCRKFYEDIGVCHPDSLCNRIKNPIHYAKTRAWLLNREAEKQRKRPTKKQQSESAKTAGDAGKAAAPKKQPKNATKPAAKESAPSKPVVK